MKNLILLLLLTFAISSCEDEIQGCTDSSAINYNPSATEDDGSCIDEIRGCTDSNAINYNSNANTDDGTCMYDNTTNFDAVLFANYENPVGEQPTLSADLNMSTSFINIEEDPILSEQNGRIFFNYSAVTFKENKDVYSIDEILTERKNSNDWIVDDENILSWTFSKSLDLILVLDVSSSLGGNIETVKENAKLFVSNILTNNSEAKVGIMKFSRGSVYKELSSDEIELHTFIDETSTFNSPDIGSYEIEGRSETALFETVDNAINELNGSGARGKGILTFTDGINNFWFDPVHFENTQVIDKLNNSNIANYTIGFDGNQGTVDKTSLENISINGDFSFPTNLDELNEVFEKFSNNVAAVYDLIYETNNSEFNGVQEYRFLFTTTLISQ